MTDGKRLTDEELQNILARREEMWFLEDCDMKQIAQELLDLREMVEIGAACVYGEMEGLWTTPGENEKERFMALYDK